jgi:hypothetical protein
MKAPTRGASRLHTDHLGDVCIGEPFMRSGAAVSLALCMLVFTDAPSAAQPRGPRRGDGRADQYGWLSSLEEGKARARQSGRPLMVVVRCVP